MVGISLLDKNHITDNVIDHNIREENYWLGNKIGCRCHAGRNYCCIFRSTAQRHLALEAIYVLSCQDLS